MVRKLNRSPDTPSCFPTDSGLTARGAFSRGAFHGDGWQASHWKANLTCSAFIGIMNPYLCDGQGGVVTAADIAVFDAIGWNFAAGVADNPDYSFSTTAFIPGPATWSMLITGFGLVGGALRRRSHRPA